MKPAAMTLTASIEGIGLLGPGLSNWHSSIAILRGEQPYEPVSTVLPLPASLPPAERRRSGALVKLTLATGLEAATAAGLAPSSLPSVFASSGGDGKNCHTLCETLASNDRQISPTRFHNSVHNIAAGYWGIATGAMTTASVLSAFDASFAAGLLEALVQVVVERTPVILLAGDTSYPEPLYRVRPIPDAFGIALVLAPQSSAGSVAQITLGLTDAEADRLDNFELEALRATVPAARSLPLLCSIAGGANQHLVLDYLDHTRLAVDVEAC